MSEEPLKCVNTEEVTINYEFLRFEKVFFRIFADYNDASAGGTVVVNDFTEGGITYNLTERLERRRQTSVGTYQTCQGETGYWITRYTSPNQLEGDPIPVEGRFPGQVVWGFPKANEPESGVRVYPVPQGVHDSWITNGTGWYSPAGYPWLGYLENCNNPNASGAVSASVSATFRYPTSYWNIEIFTGGLKIYDRSDLDYVSINGYQNWIRGGGKDYLNSPEQINPDTGRASLVVERTSSSLENRSFTYRKLTKRSGVRITSERGGTNNRSLLFQLQEIDPETNAVYKTQRIENSLIGDVKSYTLVCDGGCPSNTCEVDCGDKICCYGSDGIARDFYYK